MLKMLVMSDSGSCFDFDYDLRDLGFEVSPNPDAPLVKHTKFTEEDAKWLQEIGEACKG